MRHMNLAELDSIGPSNIPQSIGPSIDAIPILPTERAPAMTLEQFLTSQSTNKVIPERKE